MLLKVAFIAFYIFIFNAFFVVGTAAVTAATDVKLRLPQSGNKPNRLTQKQAEVEWKTKRERGKANKCVAFSIFSNMKCVKLRTTNKTSEHLVREHLLFVFIRIGIRRCYCCWHRCKYGCCCWIWGLGICSMPFLTPRPRRMTLVCALWRIY